MRRLVLLCISFCAMALLISANPVQAQNVLWVSSSGLDANTCSQTSPCATFQGAISKGSVSQINCLTSGNYGPFTITASITIDCGTGNVGNVAISSFNAITLNTGAGAIVVLRHLSLNGNGSATHGIYAPLPSGTLIVEDCMVHGFLAGDGILFSPTSGRGLLQVSNSQMFDNTIGISVGAASGQIASVTLDRVELVANGTGLYLSGVGVIAGTMRNSVVGENTGSGVQTGAGQAYFTIEESSIVNNLTYGIQTNSAGTVLNVGASTIGGNGTGVKADAGQLISFGNNQISANGVNGNFTSTVPLQ